MSLAWMIKRPGTKGKKRMLEHFQPCKKQHEKKMERDEKNFQNTPALASD